MCPQVSWGAFELVLAARNLLLYLRIMDSGSWFQGFRV